MNRGAAIRIVTTAVIFLVWMVNGLVFKTLNIVPRHQQIVARILGESYALEITKAIGFAEMLMAFWVLSRIRSKLCAFVQIITVGSMNILEFVLAPDLLLFGRANIVVASVFMAVVYADAFVLSRKDGSL